MQPYICPFYGISNYYPSSIRQEPLADKSEPLSNYGHVFALRGNKNFILKKSEKDLTEEYEIGKKFIQQTNLPQIHAICIKHIDEEKKVYKLVMERIHGKTFEELYKEKIAFNEDKITDLLQQATECASYLYSLKISWEDIHSENLFVAKENTLKICDYGEWADYSDEFSDASARACASHICDGLQDVFECILDLSSFAHHHEIRKEIAYPRSIVNLQEAVTNLGYDSNFYRALANRLESVRVEDLSEFISAYGRASITLFKQILSTFRDAKVHMSLQNFQGLGQVMPHRHWRELMIIQESSQLDNNFAVCERLQHPQLATVHKINPPYVLMARFEGTPLSKLEKSLDIELLIKLIGQAKKCCIYLNKMEVLWSNFNQKTIFIDNNQDLKLCAYRDWCAVKDPIGLVLNASLLVEQLLKKSTLPQQAKRTITYPVKSPGADKNRIRHWVNSLDESSPRLITNYFNEVIRKIRKA